MSEKLKILHVEDDSDILEICKLSLELSDDFELRQCADSRAALAVAATFNADILLLDVMMPEMGGEVLLEKLRTLPAYADTPAIFMTARAQQSEQAALLAVGAKAVIVKPFDPMTLGQQIRAVLEQA